MSRDLEEKARRMCEDWPGLGDRIGRVEENLAAELIREDSDSGEEVVVVNANIMVKWFIPEE